MHVKQEIHAFIVHLGKIGYNRRSGLALLGEGLLPLQNSANNRKLDFREVLMDQSTRWYHLLAYFFGGVFLANTIPHLVNGISGLPFQSPFASPPGKGLSSSTVNVLWAMFNLAVAYGLVARVGRFDLRRTSHAVVLGLGALLSALMLARTFGELHGGNLRPNADSAAIVREQRADP